MSGTKGLVGENMFLRQKGSKTKNVCSLQAVPLQLLQADEEGLFIARGIWRLVTARHESSPFAVAT